MTPHQNWRHCSSLCSFPTAAMIALFFLPSGVSACRVFGQNTNQTNSNNQGIVFSHTIEDGLLFINGVYVKRPYLIEATDEQFLINGMACAWAPEPEEPSKESVDQAGPPRRHGRLTKFAKFGNQRDQETKSRLVPSVRSAHALVDLFGIGNIVFVNEGAQWKVIARGSEEYEFCETLLAGNPTDQQIAQFASMADRAAEGPVREEWLRNFEPDPVLQHDLRNRMRVISAVGEENQQHVDAVGRLDRAAYPLTIVGMLLGVTALGHLLKWTGKDLAANRSGDGSPESVRYVVVALGLMLGMALLDLVWTILALQAGVMKEVNPLARGFISSPQNLTIFKVLATALGFGILYAWRQRRPMQQATWWMCLVSILMTFRWVMFDSLMT